MRAGIGVLRYGNTRELCLGLEVVTAQGEIWDGLRGLRKDNTGYDLRDLFIGAEGSLGIITAAVMKLHPAPVALELLSMAQQHAGALLTSFELMSDFSMRLVGRHFPQLRYPFGEPHGQTVLLEFSDGESEDHARALFERLMEQALERSIVEDAVVAESLAPKYAQDIVSAGFVNHLPALCRSPVALWIHSHTHTSFDYTVNGARVVCNPRGYFDRRSGQWENPAFAWDKVVEI